MPIRISRASATTVKFSTPQEIVIDHANDSIKIGDGTNLVGTTTIGADTGLDSFILNDALNPVPVINPVCPSATPASVSASTSSVQLLAANSSRTGVVFYNDSNKACFLKYGATASSSDFTIRLEAEETGIIDLDLLYQGRIDGIWESGASGSMKVTEC